MKKCFAFFATCAALLLMATAAAFAAQPAGDGWPPAAVVKEHGLDGMPQPLEAKEIWWRGVEKDEGRIGIAHILIGFHGTDATNRAIQDWFKGNGWKADDNRYTKGASLAVYLFSDGVAQIMGGIRKGVWPADSAWNVFGLSGLALPAGALVIQTASQTDSLETTLVGNKAVYDNLVNQLTTHMGKGKDLEGDGILTFWNEKTGIIALLGAEGEEISLIVEKR